MKTTTTLAIVLTLIAVGVASAQPPGQGRPGGPGGEGRPPRGNPIMRLIDENADGAISMDELDALVKKMKSLDKNKDGKLDREELAGLMPRPEGRPRGGEGRPGEGRPGGEGRPTAEAFIARVMEADKNGDGKISKEEAPERMARGFDRLDEDGDGFVSKKELEAMAARFGQGRPGGGRPGGQGGGRPPRGEGGGGRPQRPEGDRPRRGGDEE